MEDRCSLDSKIGTKRVGCSRKHLEAYARRPDVLVLALPRGGVPVGFEVGRATMRVVALPKQRPARIVVGVPISAPSACEDLAADVDDIVCAVTPEPLYAVGLWYQDFSQTTDEEVRELLKIAARQQAGREFAPHREAKGR
jgi:predicted phosphoribosyltransferase